MKSNIYIKIFGVLASVGMLLILLGGALVTKTDSGMGCGRNWPDCNGNLIPREITPEVLIVPLVAFSRSGGWLGYGGGFYDRTLEGLRTQRPTLAIGFAYAAQEAEALPHDPNDQPPDLIVTETEIISPA